MISSRRTFLRNLIISTGAPALLGGRALAEASPPDKLTETDPLALALGFKLDTTQVDGRKYPRHTAEQKCSGCILYQAKAADAFGPCTTVGAKLVPAAGWCSGYVKKPDAAS
jgi:hypothetical protein